jgi:predicted acyltransferase
VDESVTLVKGPAVENLRKDVDGGRVLSIDALRGFDMFWIIGGGTIFESLVEVWKHPVTETIKVQLEHVKWEGFRFEDLIFPTFIFLVGAVLPFSLSRRIERGESSLRIHLRILQRAVLLIVLGLIFNGLLRFDWPQTRWPGVLQRIGLCYFFAALIVLHTKWRTQAILIGVVLLLYWAVSVLVAAPGCQRGDLSMEGCLSSYIDQHLIPGSLYYKYGDNEGIISTFPAVCTALLGALAGHWLRSNNSGSRKAAGLALAGVAGVVVGYLWGLVFPIIKILWTSSYVLFAGGWSLLLLALFYWVIDVLGFRRWAFPFVVIGVNAITIYLLVEIIDFRHIAEFFLGGIARHVGVYQPLVLPVGAFLAVWLFLWFLYRHRVFFKV